MRKYEAVFIFKTSLEQEKREQTLERLKGIIGEAGEVLTVDEWGARKLAYEIDDLAEGYYVVVEFQAEISAIEELDRVCKITDGIMRHMVIRDDK